MHKFHVLAAIEKYSSRTEKKEEDVFPFHYAEYETSGKGDN